MIESEYMYNSMKQALNALDLTYTESRDSFEIMCPITVGEDIQELFLAVRPRQEMFRIMSVLPGTFKKEQQTEAVIACCAVNQNLGIGQFSWHADYGRIIFLMAAPYGICRNMREWVAHQMIWTHIILTKYGKLFEWLGEGRIPLKKFIEKIEKL